MSKALDKLQTIFEKMFEEEKKMKGKDPCWKGYEMIGMKKKNGKEVPNCVPKNEEVEIAEAKGDLTYKPEHAKWGVVPKSSKEFVKFFPKDKEADAKAHAEKTGGTLKKIDQAGRAMKEEVEQVDEISTELKQKYLGAATKKHLQQFLGRAPVRGKQELDKRRAAIQKTSKELTGKTHYREEVELEEAFSDAQIARLKAEYSKISGIDPDSESYKKLIALLDKQDKATLQKLADSGIKFISGLARNRVIRMKEDVDLDLNQLFTEAMKVKKKSEETATKKIIKKGEPLSGKQEPVKVNPEIQTKN